MQWLLEVEDCVWVKLGAACAISGGEPDVCLRSTIIDTGYQENLFVTDRLIKLTEQLPLSLCQGHIPSNLANFVSLPCPSQPTGAKIWHTKTTQLETDHSMCEAIELFRELSCGIGTGERQHASASVTVKFHPEAGRRFVMRRSFTHVSRLLIPEPSPDEKVESRLLDKIESIKKKVPQRCGARQMMCRDFMNRARARQNDGQHMSRNNVRAVFRMHGPGFAGLTQNLKLHYENQATQHQSCTIEQMSNDLERLRSDLCMHRMRMQADVCSGSPMSFAYCKLGWGDMNDWQELYDSPQFSGPLVEAMREQAATPPVVDPILQMLMKAKYVWHEPKPDNLPWLTDVAKNRDEFRSSIFEFTLVDRTEYYKFGFALQNPVTVVWYKMDRVEEALTWFFISDNPPPPSPYHHHHQ
jgi:hypothetical protein